MLLCVLANIFRFIESRHKYDDPDQFVHMLLIAKHTGRCFKTLTITCKRSLFRHSFRKSDTDFPHFRTKNLMLCVLV